MKKGTILIVIFLMCIFVTVQAFSQEEEKKDPPKTLEIETLVPPKSQEVETLEPPKTQEPPQTQEEIVKPMPTPPPPLKLGRMYFPREFVHDNKDYKRGIYLVTLISKDDIPYFQIADKKGEFLFEEMAVVKTFKSKRKFRYRVKKEILRGYEYFRIKVTKPGQYIMAYFKLKEKEKPPVQKEEPAEEEDK